MTITFRGSATASVTNGGTVSITLSSITGLAQNDVVVVAAVSTAGTAAAVTGWTTVLGPNSDSQYNNLLAYKVMGASPDTSVSFWDTGGTSDSGAGVALAFIGVDTTNVQDATAAENLTLGGDVPDPPAITPAHDNACIIAVGEQFVNAASTDTAVGNPTNYTAVTASANDSNDATISLAYRILSGGGGASENPGTWSAWTTNPLTDHTHAGTMALRELVAVGQPAVKRMGGVKQAHYVKRPSGLWFMPHSWKLA